MLALALHAPSLGHPFTLDDGVQIFRNPAVTAGVPLSAYFLDRDTTSSRRDYNTRIYRPLRNVAFRAVVRIGGVRPIAFGLANLLVYGGAALLVLLLVLRLSGDASAAAWATALWVAMPVHVEPVLYASALGDLLSLVLELLAIIAALPLLEADRPRPGRLFASTALALLAMLTKEMAVTEPLILGVLALALGTRPWRSASVRWLLAAHALVGVAYVALRTHVVGAVGQDPITRQTLVQGLQDAPWLLVHYLRISLMPLGHAASYRVPPPGALALTLTVLFLLAVAGWAWRVRRQAFSVGLAWFAIALLPVLHLVPLWADLADRFALFPSVGLALVCAAGIAALAPRWRRFAPAVAASVLAAYVGGSVLEARMWQNDFRLWRYAVDRQPGSALARFNLVTVLLAEGRLAEAALQLDTLRALGQTRADMERKRAYVLGRIGRLPEAVAAARAALRRDPAIEGTHALLGQLALTAGDLATAQSEFAEAKRIEPRHPSTGLLGLLLQVARGDAGLSAADPRIEYLRAVQALFFCDAAEAERAASACLAAAPDKPQCTGVLGQALVLAGPLTDEARRLLTTAIATLPPGVDRDRCQEALWAGW